MSETETDPANAPATTDALTTIINVLKPLASEDRQRTVGAAMLFLGETAQVKHHRTKDEPDDHSDAADGD